MRDNSHSLEFKLKAIAMVVYNDYSISAAADKHLVSNFKMYSWVKKYAPMLKEMNKKSHLRLKAEDSLKDVQLIKASGDDSDSKATANHAKPLRQRL
ncbi:transposase [Psychrosphaera sp. B3R10]|uniref:transposase n=1 Tax=unclassified Psychrosphaera TaxID=2641570 RepID=UPI001C09B19B|nr:MULTISPECIES: transposase [unclassified Psychrosphaera]MBU2882738.1 transposase [Psychrosphaera sp. I2R16]MBU2989244.1 transposase [Psychrosphaera sp. B3R10]MDO6721380.1 transposase [Psychrosphaera sp. 1_MG-2023]